MTAPAKPPPARLFGVLYQLARDADTQSLRVADFLIGSLRPENEVVTEVVAALRTMASDAREAMLAMDMGRAELGAPSGAPGTLPPLERALSALATVVTDGNSLSLDLANMLTVESIETRDMAADALRRLRGLVLEASTEHGILAPLVRIDGE